MITITERKPKEIYSLPIQLAEALELALFHLKDAFDLLGNEFPLIEITQEN